MSIANFWMHFIFSTKLSFLLEAVLIPMYVSEQTFPLFVRKRCKEKKSDNTLCIVVIIVKVCWWYRICQNKKSFIPINWDDPTDICTFTTSALTTLVASETRVSWVSENWPENFSMGLAYSPALNRSHHWCYTGAPRLGSFTQWSRRGVLWTKVTGNQRNKLCAVSVHIPLNFLPVDLYRGIKNNFLCIYMWYLECLWTFMLVKAILWDVRRR